MNCIVPQTISTTSNFSLSVGSSTYFAFPFLEFNATAYITLTFTSADPSARFTTFARHAGRPSAQIYDVAGAGGILTIQLPLPGQWYAYVELLAASQNVAEIIVTYSGLTCPAGSYGLKCNDTVIPVTASALSRITPLFENQYVYFSVVANPFLWFSVQPLGAAPLLISATVGNLPYNTNVIVKNCNQPNCNSVYSIKLPNSTFGGNQTWIVAVTSTVNTSLGAWVQSLCAPGCDPLSGNCQDAGADIGKCSCLDGFDGIECLNPTGLPSQYIVLIIIASLVVTSAVIGFIAWAYMRRKRVHYEKVV